MYQLGRGLKYWNEKIYKSEIKIIEDDFCIDRRDVCDYQKLNSTNDVVDELSSVLIVPSRKEVSCYTLFAQFAIIIQNIEVSFVI